MSQRAPSEFQLRWRITFLLVTMLLASVGFGVVLPTLPFLARQLHASDVEFGLAISLFSIAQLLGSPLWGRASDRIGRRPILMIGVTGYGVASALLALAPNVVTLLALRALAGGFVGAIGPGVQGLAADWTGPRERAKVIGYTAAMNGIGFVIGPLVGTVLGLISARAPFVGVGALALLNAALGLYFLPREGPPAQWAGPVTPAPGMRAPRIFGGLDGALWRRFMPFYIASIVLSTAYSNIATVLAFFFVDHLHTASSTAGWGFAVNGGVAAIIQLALLPRVYDRLRERMTLMLGFVMGAVGYAVLAMSPTLAMALAGIVIFAGARGFAFPTLTTAVSLRAPEDRQGVSLGWRQTCIGIGRTIGPLVASALYALHEQLPFLISSGLLAGTAVYFLFAVRGDPVEQAG
ncbi:MAG TPA: MFS transporter [Gammaproteobacteria bacterium]|nr:MFS transporter [Gammaproteobacteria bacterium]